MGVFYYRDKFLENFIYDYHPHTYNTRQVWLEWGPEKGELRFILSNENGDDQVFYCPIQDVNDFSNGSLLESEMVDYYNKSLEEKSRDLLSLDNPSQPIERIEGFEGIHEFLVGIFKSLRKVIFRFMKNTSSYYSVSLVRGLKDKRLILEYNENGTPEYAVLNPSSLFIRTEVILERDSLSMNSRIIKNIETNMQYTRTIDKDKSESNLQESKTRNVEFKPFSVEKFHDQLEDILVISDYITTH